ncbi:EpsG family protein [Pseudoxanthomonas sp. PXM02]|uniref:EpsG family protein n=1 Tax=Pseudoxanthomonas sp. PXM02 TaxID=2769294 RepID=UPI00177C3648|nr:EpsG family protein [Pseudoxanthomonas sp. PXM02]MBD9478919.1 EpsG family protein [Pseudoxanthomonas sp. PXM02]
MKTYTVPLSSPLRTAPHDAATRGLGVLVVLAVAAFACWVVGSRPLHIGEDTETYAAFFDALGAGLPETRLEIGFVYLSYALRRLGLGLQGYQTALFGLMLLAVTVAVRINHRRFPPSQAYPTLLCASLMLLFISPMFVNASINAVRQGLAAPLVFAALLCFQQRRWVGFVALGALAASLHTSSLLYLACAPALLLKPNVLRAVALLACLAYVAGLTMKMVGVAAPSLYTTVMEYTANDNYRAGVRIDFAAFTLFWYLLMLGVAPWVQAEARRALADAASVYLVMALPFFMIGWGYFSNRYLLPAWMAMSLILAAACCYSRVAPLRHPLVLGAGLLTSCGVLYVFVSRGIVI